MRSPVDELEQAALVALLRARPDSLSWPKLAAEVAELGSARTVWQRHTPVDLFDPDGTGNPTLLEALADVRLWASSSFEFHTFLESSYPARLRDVHQFPPVLFSRGHLRADDVGICVIGSRKASADGIRLAQAVSRGLIECGHTVVSGLATGIDTAAHQTALRAGGRTVAVIGTGIQRCYPQANHELQEEIARSGLVLSQFWPAAAPTKQSFPMRNAVMSAYGHATFIAEAGEFSGARIQARAAVEHGRPVILSKSVVATTTWGAALLDRPGVLVAASADEVLEQVAELLAEESTARRLLAQIKVA